MRSFTVEIHDVTPALAREITEIREALATIGVDDPTMLVVPAFEDRTGERWDLREHRGFAGELRSSELVLHGLTHKAPSAPPAGAMNWVMYHWWSRGCAEFAHLGAADARDRLRAGRQIFDACDLKTEGFIAPAWQQSAAALDAVANAGFRFTAFFDHLEVFTATRAEMKSPVLTFAAPGPLVDHPKRWFMRAVEASARDKALLRVAIHPEDVHGARPLDHILERIRFLSDHRERTTYAEWL
jgi:predicted deacetylase